MINHTDKFYKKQFDNINIIINDDNSNIIINDDNSNLSYIIDLIKTYFGLNQFLIKIKDDFELLKKFIIKCEIEFDLFNNIKNNINKMCKGNYKVTYCLEYKLILILHLKNDFANWKSLNKCIFYEPNKTTKDHYKTIYRQYRYWSSKGIFKQAFYDTVPVNNNIINDSDSDIANDDFFIIDSKKDLFIDATFISNKYGSEDVVINPELTKKNVTKLTTISDVDGFIMALSLSKSKDKIIIYNNSKKQIKTANHDVELIQQVLNECNPNIKIFNDINKLTLIGDKGYKTDKKFFLKNELITIISPNKKNQKNNMINRHQKRKLGYRFIIENSINGFKQNSRISVRKDRKSNTFMSWVYISCLSHNLKINKKVISRIN